jgi:hypothetical protein
MFPSVVGAISPVIKSPPNDQRTACYGVVTGLSGSVNALKSTWSVCPIFCYNVIDSTIFLHSG